MHFGNVFNIQRYSIHDGPGVRTTVFLKGCPLKCLWCHNPESQMFCSEIMFKNNKCDGCTECTKHCSNNAIKLQNGSISIDNLSCKLCFSCVKNCFTGALSTIGKMLGTTQILEEILKDRIFYEESGGGVTFSGGEPLAFPDFLVEMLSICKKEGISTAVDTSGFAKWEDFEKICPHTDLFLFDIKMIDDERHIKYTGVSNKIIIENLKKLASLKKRIFARIPLIPQINDDNDNIDETIRLINNIGFIEKAYILPYHNNALHKQGSSFGGGLDSHQILETATLHNNELQMTSSNSRNFNQPLCTHSFEEVDNFSHRKSSKNEILVSETQKFQSMQFSIPSKTQLSKILEKFFQNGIDTYIGG